MLLKHHTFLVERKESKSKSKTPPLAFLQSTEMITKADICNDALGALFGEVLGAFGHFVNDMREASSEQLHHTIHRLLSKIDQIVNSPSTDSDSLKDWRCLQGKLREGVELLKHCQGFGALDVFAKYRLLSLKGYIIDFLQTQGLVDILSGVQDIQLLLQNHTARFERQHDVMLELLTEVQKHSRQLEVLKDLFVTKMPNNLDQHSFTRQPSLRAMVVNSTPADQKMNSRYHVPDVSDPVMGFDPCISHLRRLLFQSGVNVVGVTAMGGSGKTTLALTLCKDARLKDFFNNNVVFITVSQQPNFVGILELMWNKIVGGKSPGFQNDEDARHQLQIELGKRASEPILVVLDDVWLRSDVEKLLFREGHSHKTLVTTRKDDAIPNEDYTRIYRLQLLEESDALRLFCFWAFRQETIPNTQDETLVKQVQAECKRLPLALKVIGSSLRGKPGPFWVSSKKKLQRAKPVDEDHRNALLDRLKTSIDALDDQSRRCFLDFGAFPEGRKVPVDALLHIWVHVRGMDWSDAFVVLLELTTRNLLNLTSDPGTQELSYGCSCELVFTQHDVIRDLALYLQTSGDIIHWKRLCMPHKENGIPMEWRALKDHEAQIVSIHTGAMEEGQWSQIDFPEAEALILFFDATQYHLPPFMRRMPRLKVLLIYNYSSKHATLNGLDSFLSLTQIETIQLEKLVIPPLLEYCKSFDSLQKLSVSLCEGLKNMTGSEIDRQGLNFSKLMEITVDHCSDLEELPTKICDLSSLQRLSVTNCHLLHKLPEDLGRLSSLRVLSLSACLKLATLPASIGKLGHLKFLDISLCGGLKKLPVGIGQLSSLEKLDMRECSGLRQLPKEVDRLTSLRHVICDEKVEQQWLSVKASAIPELRVEAVEESFDLGWL